MSSHHRPHLSSSSSSLRSPTYTSLATLRDQLRSTKITERRAASKQLLEKLQDFSTKVQLELEAQIQFDHHARRRAATASSHGNTATDAAAATFPRERVSILYRGLLEAAIFASRKSIDGSSASDASATRKRRMANQTGLTAHRVKFNAEDVMFPYRVFLQIDGPGLEWNDGVAFLGSGNCVVGGSGSGSGSGRKGGETTGDWKNRLRYGHHLSTFHAEQSAFNASSPSSTSGQTFSATHYNSYDNYTQNTDQRTTHLSPKEIISCVSYILDCLADDDCCNFAQEQLLQWLSHICARPEYVVHLGVHLEVSYILHEVGWRLNRMFEDGDDGVGSRGGSCSGRNLLLSPTHARGGNGSGNRSHSDRAPLTQACLLNSAKCLSALIYQLTTRLGIGMQLYIRPVIEMVAIWAENAWSYNHHALGGGAAVGDYTTTSTASASANTHKHNNNNNSNGNDFYMSPITHKPKTAILPPKRNLRSETDIAAMIPYLYSTVTNLLSSLPQQSIPILSEHGRALLRFAKKHYVKPTIVHPHLRDALTEYISGHLMVAEMSGMVSGLLEGDLGPLVVEESREGSGVSDGGDANGGSEYGTGGAEEFENDDNAHVKQLEVMRKRTLGATLDQKAINDLLDMICSKKVWESIFPSHGGGAGAMGDKKKKGRGRRNLSGRSGVAFDLSEGGGVWTPLDRRQRRHLELMSRLLRISQRLYLAEAEAAGGGTHDALESLIEAAEERKRRSGIEQGEVDIEVDEEEGRSSSSTAGVDVHQTATLDALACSPCIRMISRRLYQMNPKLEAQKSSAYDSLSQNSFSSTKQQSQPLLPTQQRISKSRLPSHGNKNGNAPSEIALLELCPMLQALLVEGDSDTSSNLLTFKSTQASTSSKTFGASKTSNRLDSIRPTAIATLQFVCACAEAFPRGECWSSSARQNWSTVLDERHYPGGTSARILERHGSSPSDAAAMVYLLGTTLENCGGSGGEESVQIWTLVALLKMAESCAIICSREGLTDSSSFGSSSQLEALRLAWQYVWNTLLRYDLRYSAYTSACYQNNAGELVIQLLTQIIRYQCTDRRRLIPLQVSSDPSMETDTPLSATATPDAQFVQAEQGKIWNLPVFENTASIFSGAPFELIVSLMQFCTFTGSALETTTAISARNAARDRNWFVSFCLNFIEIAMSDSAISNIRRSFLPFVGTCLSALISDGRIIFSVSTFELDSLARFGVTEDAEPGHPRPHQQNEIFGTYVDVLHIHDELWTETIAPNEYIFEKEFGLAKRVLQGREALLSKFVDADFERERLWRFMEQIRANKREANTFSKNNHLADVAFERVKSLLEDALYQLRFDIDDGETQEENAEIVQNDATKAEILPFVTGYLCLILSIVLSKHCGVEDVAKNIEGISAGTLIPALESVTENIPSQYLQAPDFAAVLGHLHGILSVVTNVFALRDGGSGIPRIFDDFLTSTFHSLQSCLKEYRQTMYTYASNNPLVTPTLNGRSRHVMGSDSEDESAQVQNASQPLFSKAKTSDDFTDDDFMDVDYDDSAHHRQRMKHAPPTKRRKVANPTRMAATIKPKHIDSAPKKSIDSYCAWSCASLMVTLHPSLQCLEIVASHLVWPEDFNDNDGYDPVSTNPDPIEPLVCANIFCRKSVILRQHLSDPLSLSNQPFGVGQSALILCLEIILQARRYASQSSKFFMSGFELISEFVKIADYGESDHSMSSEESELVIDSIYPEGCSQKNEDYRSLRQLKKKLKHRVFYRSEQQQKTAISVFLFAQSNLHSVFDGSFPEYFVKAALRHPDEHVRSFACDALGAVFTSFSSQEMIAAEIIDKVLPPLSSSNKKFNKWIESLNDPKLSDDLSKLETAALDDARLSYQYQAIDCIGLIAGTSSDVKVRKDMIWKLVNIATKKPKLTLLCRRACERAAFLLGFRCLDDLFDDLAPHLLVKWVESRRALCNLPILLTSPFITKELCRRFPNEILRMVVDEGGWSYDFWRMEEVKGEDGVENRLLDEKVLPTFLHDIGPFLIPVILVSPPRNGLNGKDKEKNFETTTYIREYVLTLTEEESDEQIAKILRFHIRDIFGFVFVLQGDHDNIALQDACHNASQYLRRCVSDAHIEREGARQAFLVLRRILMLHCKSFSIAGHGEICLDPRLFIDGIKCVSKQLTKPSSDRPCAGFLEPAGSSLTECVVIVKYWLSKSLSAQQRENAGGTFSLLCIILRECIEDRTIQSHELRFCLLSFISIILEPENSNVCPSILESLKSVLGVLFSASNLEHMAADATSTLHKLSLSLLQVHQNAYLSFYRICMATFNCFQFNQKTSRGLLNGIDDTENLEFICNEPSQPINLLKTIISKKSDFDESLLANTMVKSFECLEMIASSGTLPFEDILGAEDFSDPPGRHRDVFSNHNEKFCIETLHKIVPNTPGADHYDDMDTEYENFVRVMNDHPLSTDAFDHDSRRTVAHSVDSRARFLALLRLEKALASTNDQIDSCPIFPKSVYESLLLVCCSKDPEESRVVASRCLGGIKRVLQAPYPTSQPNEPYVGSEADMKEYFDNPLLAIKTKILSMLGQFLQSDCAETSLVAMKTAKALLATSDGKRSWKSLDDDVKGMLNPFVNANESSLKKEAILISNRSLLRLKGKSGVPINIDDDSWCWKEALWTFRDRDDSSSNSWIQLVVCSIISCCYGTDSIYNQEDESPGFFRMCAGLCAKEASFAACIFPGVIYHLLDSEDRDHVNGKSDSVRDIILARTAIGSPISKINAEVTKCFSLLLRTTSQESLSSQNLRPASQALLLVLNTLELLKSLTEHRFLTSPDHIKNISTIPKAASTKKRRSRNAEAAPSGVEGASSTPQWRGYPYGVVLRLDGFDVAKACYHAKRFYSAIYYAEMSMQNLIGVSNFFEEIARSSQLKPNKASVRDISGFGIIAQANEDENMRDITRCALLAKDIISSCLTEIQENDELEGVLAQASSMNLKQNITALMSHHSRFLNQSIPKLLDLDIHLQMNLYDNVNRSNTDIMQDFTSVSDCLEDIGLNHIKRHYLIGVETLLDRNKEFERSRNILREKWFEDSLKNTSRWDDILLPNRKEAETETETETSSPTIFATGMAAGDKCSSQHAPSFYESVYQSILSLIQMDLVGGRSHILQARKSVISDLGYLARSESKLRSVAAPVSKLSVLGNLDDVIKVLEGSTPSTLLLNQWGLCDYGGDVQRVGTLLLNSDLASSHGRVTNQKSDALMFRSLETAQSVKELCLKILMKESPDRRKITHALISQVYKSCCLYSELGRHDLAKVSLSRMRSLVDSFMSSEVGDDFPNTLPLLLHLEDAKIMTCQNNFDTAITHCKMIVNYLKNDVTGAIDQGNRKLLAKSLLLGGIWMTHQNVDSAKVILSSFFQKAAELALDIHNKTPSDSSTAQASAACFKLGEFAANLYSSLDARTTSDTWKRRNIAVAERRKELEVCSGEVKKLEKKARRSSDNLDAFNELWIHRETLKREVTLDERETRSVETSIKSYLFMAMKSYCSALKLSTPTTTDVSKHVFRLLSLWFKNCDKHETKTIVNEEIKLNLSAIPSYRFVPLIYQLFSRIDSSIDDDENSFQRILRRLVLKICAEHPYHGIVQLIALSNGKRVGSGVSGRHATAYLDNVGDAKVEAAKCVLQDLRKHGPEHVVALMGSYECLMDAYIDLALYSTTKIQDKQTEGISFSKCKLDLDVCVSGGRRGNRNTSITNMPVIITQPPPVRPDAKYGDGKEDPVGAERVIGFNSTFDLTPSGIHRPKIVKCHGSKGTIFKQLVKGEDDLRQDAIMQQVFGTVNDLLRQEDSNGNDVIRNSTGVSMFASSSRRLKLITYGITPLSPASGVLEWVNNTMAFGDFLTDSKGRIGAHSKYYPGEWGNVACRKYYDNATAETRRQVFDEICDNFSPVFRFFFLEYFSSSMEAWYTARMSYTRSCAVNSIVGHILGIGDRHTQNILVHTKTGEIVHIDFGIVFEQGKALTTPETVPFRLTRDVVDGMGPCGTEGEFSKAAEATMSVLRSNADALLTILSAVVSDPLYKWNVSPVKARQRQRSHDEGESHEQSKSDILGGLLPSRTDENRNDSADRAIAKIHEKLQGYEEGTSGEHKSVAGQVKLLINEARDPNNLCVLFAGWTPWI